MKLRHVGIVVQDLAAAEAFWQAAGFTVQSRADEQGDVLDRQLGLEKTRLTSVKMADELGQVIELLKFHSHSGAFRHPQPTSMGLTHVALAVADMDDACRVLFQAGASFPNGPAEGYPRMTYCRGPEGLLIELVEIP